MDSSGFDPFRKNLYCDFAVELGIDFASSPKFSSNFPFGFVHLATWKKNDKENTLQCLYSKGYRNDSEDIGDGLIKLSFDGHFLMVRGTHFFYHRFKKFKLRGFTHRIK